MTVKSRRFLFLAAILVALNTSFWLAGGGLALPKSIVNQFFGSRMVRAEVILQAPGGTQDWRIDRGVVSTVSGANVTLMEADGTSVTVAIDPAARIQGARKVKAHMRVVLYHLASQPAQVVQVEP